MNRLTLAYNEAALSPVGKVIKDLNEALARQTALLGKVGEGAASASALYDAQQKARAAGMTVSPAEASTIGRQATELHKATQAQEQFNDVFSKSTDPIERFNEKLDKASQLLKLGTITQEGFNRAKLALEKERDSGTSNKEEFKIGLVIDKLKDQIATTKLLSDEKERSAKFDQIKESLDGKHIKLTSEQTAEIKGLIATLVEQQHVQQQLDSIHKASAGVLQDYARTQLAVDMLLKKSPQFIQQYAKALDDARMKVLEVNNSMVAGFEHGLLAELKKVSDVTGIVSNYMTSAFSTLENSWVDFLKTGKFQWNDFAKSIIESTMHMVTQLLIIKPILEALRASISGSTSGASTAVSSLATLVGFAGGGDFIVGGSSSTDSNVVAFRATAGERVIVQTPAQQQSGGTGNTHVSVNVYATDAQSFLKSENQVAAATNRALRKAQRVM
jgi:lambda family phage tail tape measure protein